MPGEVRHSRMKISLLGVLLFAAILLASCASPTPTPVVPKRSTPTPAPTPVVVDVNLLYANPWVLVAYGNPDNPTVVGQAINITLQFTSDGQISGFGGCNNYSGSFQAAQDGALSVSKVATTRMACSEGMEQENTYLGALQNAKSFTFDSQGRLNIVYGATSKSGQVMIFVSSAEPLTSTSWILVSYGDPASPQKVAPGSTITAVFTQDGFVSGSSGCNQYNASYTLQDQQIALGPIATTQMACPSGMEAEQAYLQALGTAQQIAISGQKLTITYNQGAGILTYTSANLPLEYTLWTLFDMNGQPVPAETSITATFTPGETPNTGSVGGSSGCNQYSAAYTQEGNNLTFQPAAATMMACPTGMDTEQAYLRALQAATSYQIFVDKLVLTNPSGTLTFIANRTPLSGALWRLVSLGDVNNPLPPVQGSQFAAQFSLIPGSPSGILSGTTGCNEYSAAYAASIDEIKINPPVSGQNKTCAPGLSDQEKLYFLSLNDAKSYRISGNTLVIPYDSSKQQLVFEGTQLEEAKRPPLIDLNATTWYLWFMNNAPVMAGTSIYAQIAINADGASGTISGSAGCNSYVASFGQNMGVQTALNASQMCSKPTGIMDQERAYVNMLSRAYGYWQTGDQLILNTGQGVLTYRTARPPESNDQTHLLVDQTWYLVSYKNIYSVPGTQEPYTTFQSNGTLTGYTGCNTLQGSYQTNIQQITITNLSSTKTACPNKALADQEQAMLGILGSAKSYQVVETVMQLVGDQGVLNYSLTPLHRPEEIVPPQAVISAPANAEVNQTVTFDATASTGQLMIVSWQWDFGDGSKGTGQIVQHVYNKHGSYTVQMTVTDQRGYRDSDAHGININQGAQPSPTPTQPPQPTPTQVPQPTSALPPQPTEVPPQVVAPTATLPPEPSATVPPPEPTATLPPPPPTATLPPPTPTETPTPVPVPPQAAIQGPTEAYAGDPVTFDASGSIAGSSPIASYAWNFGDGTTAGPAPESSQTTIFNNAGTYQVSVVVTDQNGLSSSATAEVVISAKITTPVVWSLDNLSGRVPLAGTEITLQFAAGQFSGFAGCNSYQGTYTSTANPDGTYSVTLSGMTTTAMSCPEEIMAQERIYLAMLPTVTTAQIQGDRLTLTFPAGTAPDGQAYLAGSLTYVQAVTVTPY